MASVQRFLNPYNVKQEVEIVSRSELFKNEEDEPGPSNGRTEDLQAVDVSLRSSLLVRPPSSTKDSETEYKEEGIRRLGGLRRKDGGSNFLSSVRSATSCDTYPTQNY